MILVKHFAYAKVKTFETDEMSLCESLYTREDSDRKIDMRSMQG